VPRSAKKKSKTWYGHGLPYLKMGSLPGHLIVIEFPDRERVREWYRSPAYQQILALRTGNSESARGFCRRRRPQSYGLSGIGEDYRFSRNTACWPKKFQNHHGIDRPIFWPLASSAVAFSTVAPSSSHRLTKSRMVQKWMLGVSYQE